jgi:epoxyqueuosine reductase
MSMVSLADIQIEAQAAGFALLGIRRPSRPVHYAAFEKWLENDLYASMEWIAKPHSRSLRADPALLLPGSRALISLAVTYPSANFEASEPGSGWVASYAWVADYHKALTSALRQFARRLIEVAGMPFHFKAFVDSSPLLERDLAAMSGLGWIGKNTCLISPNLGSYMFLTEILVDIELPETEPFEVDRCGTCRRCIDACPTGCIRADRTIDAGRCISYLTIEHKGAIPPDLRPRMGAWVFGCDICQIVCPWNRKFSGSLPSPLLKRMLDPGGVNLMTELSLTEEIYFDRYQDLPLRHTPWESYLRNVVIAAGNSGLDELVQPIAGIMTNSPNPILRGHAAWALGRYQLPAVRAILIQALRTETDLSVRLEIQAVLDK